MKLISWNVNGLRACLTHGFAESFAALDADIFSVQETKMQPGQADFAMGKPAPVCCLQHVPQLIDDIVCQIFFGNFGEGRCSKKLREDDDRVIGGSDADKVGADDAGVLGGKRHEGDLVSRAMDC